MEIRRMVFSPIQVNTYIVWDATGECAVIDCGCYTASEFSVLGRFVSENRLKPVLLLNTHCHLDHVFGNRFMLEKYSLRTFCSREEEPDRKNAINHAAMFGLKMEVPPEPAGFISEGGTVIFGETSFEIFHVPGHTKGSLAFYERNSESLFTGDALFSGSIGRTDLPGGDYESLINSIRSKLFTLPGDTIVYPGHGESTTIKKESESNPFFINS